MGMRKRVGKGFGMHVAVIILSVTWFLGVHASAFSPLQLGWRRETARADPLIGQRKDEMKGAVSNPFVLERVK